MARMTQTQTQTPERMTQTLALRRQTTCLGDWWRGSARTTAVVAVVFAVALAGCESTESRNPLDAAIARNDSRHVDPRFEEHPVVLDLSLIHI